MRASESGGVRLETPTGRLIRLYGGTPQRLNLQSREYERIRAAFVDGFPLVKADFAEIEARVLACMKQD